MLPRVLIYRNKLLPISETFVFNQSMRLDRFEAYFLGAKTAQGKIIDLPNDRIFLINRGGVGGWIDEAGYKLLGYLPKSANRWLNKIKPALVHAHFGSDGAIAMAVARSMALPLIVSFHGIDATLKDEYARKSYLTQRLYLLRRSQLANFADRMIAQSEFMKELLIKQHGFSEEKISIIRHGIDLDDFNPKNAMPEWGHILYVGRIIERKGLHILINAIRSVKKLSSKIHLTVIGDGPQKEHYQALARRELGNSCDFLGAQSNRIVNEYLKRSYIFCMPSITMQSGETETLGIVFLEAQAMKVPVVSFRTGGIPEVVLHQKTGLLAEEGNINQLTEYLIALLENRETRDRMGREGRKWVERSFNLKVQNEKLEKIYDEVTH